MKILEVKSLAIPEVKVVRFQRFSDDRGYFTETYRESDFKKVFPDFHIKQVNESHSSGNVIRGLHLQWNPYMGKLIRAVSGHMVDIIMDVRKGSPTYGKIIGHDMPENPKEMVNEWIWVPIGFVHGNFYLEETSIEYFCTSEYSPGCEAGISPLAPDLDWSLCNTEIKQQLDNMVNKGILISEKDKKGLTLTQWGNDPRSKNFIYAKV